MRTEKTGERGATERGFTHIEVLIALALLATMAAGIAQLVTVAMAATRSARRQSSTAVLAEQKMEQLRALTWGYDSGRPGTPVADVSTNLSVDPATGDGSGLAASPSSAIDTTTAGFVDYLDDRGQWVGTGAVIPAGAVYIRRWSVQPLAGQPDSLVVQVLVSTAAREPRLGASGTRGRQTEDTRLVTIRTRTSR